MLLDESCLSILADLILEWVYLSLAYLEWTHWNGIVACHVENHSFEMMVGLDKVHLMVVADSENIEGKVDLLEQVPGSVYSPLGEAG
jgi:hypothetical protein